MVMRVAMQARKKSSEDPIRICPMHVCQVTYPIHTPHRFEATPDDAHPGNSSASQGHRTSTFKYTASRQRDGRVLS